jgi:hypothetical protein
MRTGKCFILLFTILITGQLRAQSTPDVLKHYGTVIKTSPFVFGWGILPFTSEIRYVKEVVTAPRQSVLFGLSYLTRSPVVKVIIGQSQPPNPVVWIQGIRLQFMYRMYYKKGSKAPFGWYTGPYYSYATAKYSMRNWQRKGVYIEGTQWHLSWVVGKQRRLGKNLCYDIYGGMGYKENTWDVHHSISKISKLNLQVVTDNNFYTSHFKICFGFNLGWAF